MYIAERVSREIPPFLVERTKTTYTLQWECGGKTATMMVAGKAVLALVERNTKCEEVHEPHKFLIALRSWGATPSSPQVSEVVVPVVLAPDDKIHHLQFCFLPGTISREILKETESAIPEFADSGLGVSFIDIVSASPAGIIHFQIGKDSYIRFDETTSMWGICIGGVSSPHSFCALQDAISIVREIAPRLQKVRLYKRSPFPSSRILKILESNAGNVPGWWRFTIYQRRQG